jgi:hypothetical protein
MAQSVMEIIQGGSEGAAQSLISSREFEPVLQKVEERARAAVVAETKANAVSLIAVAVAAGAFGGAIFPRGIFGAAMGAAIGFWGVKRLMAPKETAPPSPETAGIGGYYPSRRQVQLHGFGDFNGWQGIR